MRRRARSGRACGGPVPPGTLRYVDDTCEWLLVEDGALRTEARRATKLAGIAEAIQAWSSMLAVPVTLTAIRSAVGGKAADHIKALRGLVDTERVIHLATRRGYCIMGRGYVSRKEVEEDHLAVAIVE